eukprot:CAMPEP_0174749824 /NCGR_PEP_ID=MMETSP1094-20130205/96482_1 /TAXON_ID=156173 /ORGANISM="Chrysochromulina brevifilum, Strain UTEX LB 985" /LENGTH=103 /DNA_ID=CAMNT_0015955081 /DNA_START=188 /DNA_END=499 /DNA_ORIENTATION=+
MPLIKPCKPMIRLLRFAALRCATSTMGLRCAAAGGPDILTAVPSAALSKAATPLSARAGEDTMFFLEAPELARMDHVEAAPATKAIFRSPSDCICCSECSRSM